MGYGGRTEPRPAHASDGLPSPASQKRPRRLYTAQEMAESRQAWIDADLCDQEKREWKEWRYIAAMEGGIIFPPEGTRYDSWADDNPSQRAIICRTMREDPELLLRAIRADGAASWAKVIAIVCRERDWRVDEADKSVEWERSQRRQREADRTEARATLDNIRSILKF